MRPEIRIWLECRLQRIEESLAPLLVERKTKSESEMLLNPDYAKLKQQRRDVKKRLAPEVSL